MDNHSKRMLLASGLCLLVVMAWLQYLKLTMPPTLPTTQTATTQPVDGERVASTRPTTTKTGDEPPSVTNDRYAIEGAAEGDVVTIGDDRSDDDNPYKMKIEIDPLGASVRQLTLSDHRKTVRRKKTNPSPPAYTLLEPVYDAEKTYQSFVAKSIRLPDLDNVELKLSDVVWHVDRVDVTDGEGVRLWTRVSEDGIEILELSRTYRILKKSRQFQLDWRIDNITDRSIKVVLTDTGPTGIEPADERFDHPRVMVAVIDPEGNVSAGENDMREKVIKSEDHRRDFKPGENKIVWSALSNKYFSCLIYPKPLDGSKSIAADYVDRVSGTVAMAAKENPRDLSLEQVLAPRQAIVGGKSLTMSFDVYCGDKNESNFADVPMAGERHYALVTSPDRSACTLESIGQLLNWLLGKVYSVVGNYGVAIILLVIVVRLCLHPVTKKAQVNMMRMQKNTARIKPKMDALQKQYKNDKQKLGEETMKLYRDEGISPAGTLSGCLPMFLQTPIWIALYTMLNTDVTLRHQPFFWYIRDLSAPDHFIQFNWSFSIPLIGGIMGPISALNILPIIMAIVMWGQMKISQKIAKAKEVEKPKSDDPNAPDAPPDMMAQQQKMMGFLMPLFGLMFYNMPSGLCLYILSNSLLGMGELYFIRKQLREEDEKGEFEKLHKPKKGKGRFAQWFEDLQKKAELAKQGQLQSQQQKGKNRKKPRF